MRKIISHLRLLCVMFFAAAIGLSGNADAGYWYTKDWPWVHTPDNGFYYGYELKSAIRKRKFELAKRLVWHGANVNHRESSDHKYRFTPLHVAAMHGNGDIITFLVKSGANIEARDSQSRTPLALAAEFGIPEAVRALLAAGADHRVESGGVRESVVHAAARNPRNPAWIINMLFSHKAGTPEQLSPDVVDANKSNVLHAAANARDNYALFVMREMFNWVKGTDQKLWSGRTKDASKWRFPNLKTDRNTAGQTPYDYAFWRDEKKKAATYYSRWAANSRASILCKLFGRDCYGRPPEIMLMLDPNGGDRPYP